MMVNLDMDCYTKTLNYRTILGKTLKKQKRTENQKIAKTEISTKVLTFRLPWGTTHPSTPVSYVTVCQSSLFINIIFCISHQRRSFVRLCLLLFFPEVQRRSFRTRCAKIETSLRGSPLRGSPLKSRKKDAHLWLRTRVIDFV